jgi:hypothetical protein
MKSFRRIRRTLTILAKGSSIRTGGGVFGPSPTVSEDAHSLYSFFSAWKQCDNKETSLCAKTSAPEKDINSLIASSPLQQSAAWSHP